MYGFATAVRCAYCRMLLMTVAVRPGPTVLVSIQCRSRTCRKERRGLDYYYIRDGRARGLTAKERADMVKGEQEGASRPQHT